MPEMVAGSHRNPIDRPYDVGPMVGAGPVMVVREHPLDPQQLAAVMDDADTQLVIAAAGTGKTTTLVGKVRHLVDTGVDPKGILLISLTNNTVADLRASIDSEFGGSFPGDVMTIHALGNRILRRRSCVGKDRTRLLGRIMYDTAEVDRRFARALLLYVEGLRTVGYSDVSLCGISIRNRGLRNFADALFECGIRCTYERPVVTDRETKPASVHAEDGKGHRFTVYSDDDVVRKAAKEPREAWEHMERHGFQCERLNPNDLAAEVINAWGDRLPEAMGALISRCKSTGTTIGDLRRANGRNDTKTRPRVEEKLSLLDRVWDEYNMLCMQGDMADYDDMVIQATESVRAGGPYGRRYTHVLVDEYQDVSPTLVGLLRAIRDRTGFRLFCVGDDWQSIYSFSGGDVWQFYDFEKVWGGYGTVSVSRIETTYRCPQTIVDLSGRFVSANPMQQRKEVKGVRDPPFRPVQLLPVNSDRDIPRAIANRLDFIDPGETVFVIGRTRADVYALGYGNGQFAFSLGDRSASGSVDVVYRRWDEDSAGWVDVRQVRFLTAHSSKGLEADNVFILADRERGGFPNTVSDELSDLFETRDEGIPLAEERRVFYVAMTRARRRLFIVNRTDEDHYAQSARSPFVTELLRQSPVLSRSTPFCPECFGPVRIVEHDGRRFYGCCDYPNCRGVRRFDGI